MLSESDKQTQIQAEISDMVYDRGNKPGNNYPDLEPGNIFWNRVQVPGSGHQMHRFGFKAGHLTALCLVWKQMVDYYTNRSSGVFACFIDFQKHLTKPTIGNYFLNFGMMI